MIRGSVGVQVSGSLDFLAILYIRRIVGFEKGLSGLGSIFRFDYDNGEGMSELEKCCQYWKNDLQIGNKIVRIRKGLSVGEIGHVDQDR